ncbi:unnamed protein product [Withania somnifera]
MAKVSIYCCLLLIITFLSVLLDSTISQDHQVNNLQCAAPIFNVKCKVNEDCMPICKNEYKDKLIHAGCILGPDDPNRICVCGYKC